MTTTRYGAASSGRPKRTTAGRNGAGQETTGGRTTPDNAAAVLVTLAWSEMRRLICPPAGAGRHWLWRDPLDGGALWWVLPDYDGGTMLPALGGSAAYVDALNTEFRAAGAQRQGAHYAVAA